MVCPLAACPAGMYMSTVRLILTSQPTGCHYYGAKACKKIM